MMGRLWQLVLLVLVLTACGQPKPGGSHLPPTVQLGALPTMVTAAGGLTLSAQVSDKVGVSKVTFYDGLTNLGGGSTAPYTLTLTLTAAQNGLHHYSARAINTAGLVGISQTSDVTVNIPSDTSTGAIGADAAQLYRQQGVKVSLPDTFKGQALTAGGLLSEQPLGADGTFTITVLGGTSPLLHVNNPEGTPLLLGWLNPAGDTQLSARSSAAALVYYTLGLSALPDPDRRGALRTALSTSTTLDPLVQAITAALNAGQALDAPAISAALGQVKTSLAAGGLSAQLLRTQGLQVEPLAEKNGLQPNLGENNSVWLTNSRLRPAKVVIDREYYIDAAGQKVTSFQDNAFTLEVPPVTKFDGTLETIASYFALPPDQRGTVGGLLPQDSPHVTLPNLPGALKTVYTAYAYGPGLLPGQENQLSDARQNDLTELSFRFFLTDVFFPYVGDLAGSLTGKLSDDPDTAKVISAFTSKAFDLTPKLSPLVKAGSYQQALVELTSALASDGDLQDRFLKLVFQQLLQESKRKNAGGTGGGFDPVNTANTGAAFTKFKQLTGSLSLLKGGVAVVDKVLKGSNLAALIYSVASSERAQVLTLTASDVKVFLNTDLQIPDVSNPAHLTVKLEGQDEAANTDGLTLYRWTMGGAAGIGELQLQNGGLVLHPGDTVESSSFAATFISLGIDGPVPISVEVLRKTKPPSTQKQSLGSASLTLNVSNLLVSLKPEKNDILLPALCAPDKYAPFTVLSFAAVNDGALPVKYLVSGADFTSASSGVLTAHSSATVTLKVPVPGRASVSVVFEEDGRRTAPQEGSRRSRQWQGSVSIAGSDQCGPSGGGGGQGAQGGPSGIGHAEGDPHLRTFDGLSYDFQGVGDYVLTQGRTSAFQDFEAQGRFQALSTGSNVSVAVGLAAQVLGDKVEVLRVGSALQTRLNGTLLSGDQILKLPGGGGLSATAQKVTVAHPDGSWFSLDSTYTLQGQLAGTRRGQGLFGNADSDPSNDLQIKGGATLPVPGPELYREFRSSWNVRLYSPASLFSQGPDLWDPFFPAGVVNLNDLDPAKRAAAELVCLARGIMTQAILDGCIYDVTITGDPSFADYAFGVDPNVPRVLVNPALAVIEVGSQRNVGAYVTGLGDRRVTWTATGGTVIGDALATYTAPATPGNYTLTATSVIRPELSGSAKAVVFQSGRLVWTGAGDGVRWSDPHNWSGNVLPGEHDVVSINAPGVSVLHDRNDDTVLRLDAVTPLKLTGGSLSVTGAATLASLEQMGGSVRLYGATRIDALRQADGDFNVMGTLALGPSVQTGGTFSLEDSATATFSDFAYGGWMKNNGTLTLGGQTTWTSAQGLHGTGRTLNTGTLILPAGAGHFGGFEGGFENRGTFQLAAQITGERGKEFLNSGTIELQGTGSVCCDAVVTNTGRLLKTGPGDSVVASLVNSGAVEVQMGGLDLQTGDLRGGMYATASGTRLHLGNLNVSGTLSGTQTGRLYMDYSNLTVISGQEAHLHFDGLGLEFGFSSIRGPGRLVNDPGGLVKVVPGGNLTGFSLAAGAVVENLGTWQVYENASGSADSTFTNRGRLELPTNAGLGGDLNLINTGTILKSGSVDGYTTLDAAFTNSGTIRVDGGTLQLTRGLLDGGVYEVVQGATMRLLNLSARGTLSGSPAGTVWVDYGNLTVAAGQTAHLRFGGRGFTFGFSSVRGPGQLINDAGGLVRVVPGSNLTGFSFEQTAQVQNAGTWQFFEAAGSQPEAAFANSGRMEFPSDAGLGGGLTLNNTGLMIKTGGNGLTPIDADVTNTGTITPAPTNPPTAPGFRFLRALH